MNHAGALLASGRDADIYEHGPGLVLRRSKHGRSMAGEGRIMAYLHEHGYPVPAIEEVSDDGMDLVMERIDGPSMIQAISAAPWKVRRHGHTLASLHNQLHRVPPPDFLSPISILPGNSLLHLDLHPLNLIMGRHGPVVIDWSSASVGDPDIDVGLAWILMAAGDIPGGRALATVLGWGRSLMVDAFLAGFDRDRVALKLRKIAGEKAKDRNWNPSEIDRMWRVVQRGERRALRR